MKPFSECKILIVDDTESSIDVLVETLGELYEVIVAMSGNEAIKVVKNEIPDLVLLDIMMPGMNGYETCRELKANAATCDIPIIFITAMSEIEDETKGLELGAIDYVTKPISPPIVRARVKNHLELSRAHKRLKQQTHQLEKQNRELIEINRLKEDIENITRHDLKTPLNAIINFPQLIQSYGGLNDLQTEYLGLIVECGYKMLNMINLSLDLFKMEQGVYPFTPESVNILTVMDNIIKEVHKNLEDKKLSISCILNGMQIGNLKLNNLLTDKSNTLFDNKSNFLSKDKNITFIVQGETLLCYSMLANLIQNAIEASPESEKIEIILNNCYDKAMISIHNKGAIPYNIRDHFFNKYITSGKRNGTGLGAYSAKLIAQTQNGEIKMLTSEKEGTFIIVYLNK